MFDADMNGSTGRNNGEGAVYREYLVRAKKAAASGNDAEAFHLYLTAYEQANATASQGGLKAGHPVVEGLRCAWDIACRLKERSLAEYAFEQLEPYLSSDEVASCAEALQRLALEKLEEFGLSRDEVEDVAGMIFDDVLGMGGLDLGMLALGGLGGSSHGDGDDAQGAVEDAGVGAEGVHEPLFKYRDLVGFDSAIAKMHRRGIGLADDAKFREFLEMLNERHGIDRLPAVETMLFQAPAREDADRLMLATAGELGVPSVRMHMDFNAQGTPVLCVMASPDFKTHMSLSRGTFEGPGTVMLEGVDLWGSPLADSGFDDAEGFSFAQLSRGAKEAMTLIRAAVESPDVTVLASACSSLPVDDLLFDLLGPVETIDVAPPTAAERAALWTSIAEHHPSIRGINRIELVRYSANLSRYDIAMAAREAIEQAYKESVVEREFVPVTMGNLFDKIAAYQPLDSAEYHQLEESIVEDLRRELDELDVVQEEGAE